MFMEEEMSVSFINLVYLLIFSNTKDYPRGMES